MAQAERESAGERKADAGPVATGSPLRPLPNAKASSNSNGINIPDPAVIGPSSALDTVENCFTFPEDSSPAIFVMLGRDIEAIVGADSGGKRWPPGGTVVVGSWRRR